MGIAILSSEAIVAFLLVFLGLFIPFLFRIIVYIIRFTYHLFIYFVSGEYKKDMAKIDQEDAEKAKAEAAKRQESKNRGFEDEIRKKYNL
ncbi:hypothetical protein KOEU_25440 [Komagataeibacter europaeus]|uniref:Uncharacterized protein n=1 Tax=Komagataeibacter europaeus TaxID=33995 RepID=A0A0M0EGB9_KOMEU|nr:hypothetical protein [Komagataeibacter europaeus]KON63951.1 hypothetical protein KOEU_25440 [Komagataeibacter europaeus]